jgi:hypothetical protein
MPAECLQQVFERHLSDIDGEMEVAVDPGLTPNNCVDTPSVGNPKAVIPLPCERYPAQSRYRQLTRSS